MKRLLLLLMFSVFLLSGYQAQSIPATFHTNIDTAKQYASQQNVPILMVFAGSDWCRPCIQFKQQVLLDSAFQQYADSQLVILYLDFPAKKKNRLDPIQLKHNEALAEQYNKTGAFPHIILITSLGEVIAPLSYRQQTGSTFVNEVKMAEHTY